MIAPVAAGGGGRPVQAVLFEVTRPRRRPGQGPRTASAGAAVVERLPVQAPLFAERPDPWVSRWRVASRSEPGARHVVARHRDGTYGCTCRGWIFQRRPRGERRACHHIGQVQKEQLDLVF